MTYYIHIGLQKTGTTALQIYLDNYHKNINSPFKINQKEIDQSRYTSGHQFIFNLANSNKLSLSLFDKIQSNFISCENFTNPINNLKAIKNLTQFFCNHNINYEFMLTERSFEDYSESLYFEQVINSFACEVRDYDQFKHDLNSFLGKLNLFLADHPTKRFNFSEHICTDILKYVGIDVNHWDKTENLYNVSKTKHRLAVAKKISVLNRKYGYLKNYRRKLRMKYKTDAFSRSHYYCMITYLRAMLRYKRGN